MITTIYNTLALIERIRCNHRTFTNTNTILLDEVIEALPQITSIRDTIDLSQVIRCNTRSISINQQISLNQSIHKTKIITKLLSESILFYSVGSKGPLLIVHDNLFLRDSIGFPNIDIINLTESISTSKQSTISSRLNLNETITTEVDRIRTVIDTLLLQSNALGYNPGAFVR